MLLYSVCAPKLVSISDNLSHTGDEGKKSAVAMAVHGSVGEFDQTKESWASYTERLDQYFAANDVENTGKKRAILLNSCGQATYQTAKDLFAPDKPSEKTYTVIVDKLMKHFCPKPSAIVQCCKFHSKKRKLGESIATFCAELRRLSEYCAFGVILENMLRDRLVAGIADSQMQTSTN